ncbi:hypothetical protein JCM10212_006716 [Sporobolomyces blumeae]
MAIPLPAPSELLAAVRSTSAAVSLPLDDAAIDRFILSVPREQWHRLSTNHGVRLPLRFDSPRDELNLLSVLALLNFLSGYRAALHRLTGRGAYSTILSLILSAYLSDADSASSILSTKGMKSCTVASLASLAQISTHSESDHPTLGSAVKVGTKDDEAFELLGLVEGVLHETGETLDALGMADLGTWVEQELLRTRGEVASMVHSLATTFPAFRDVHVVSQPVYLFKKALWLLSVLSIRFSPRGDTCTSESASRDGPPPPFPVPTSADLAHLPIFADNVIPSLLASRPISIIQVPPEVTQDGTRNVQDLDESDATVLRASAVEACRRIVERAHELGSSSSSSPSSRSIEQVAAGGGGGGQQGVGSEEDLEWLKSWSEVELDGYLWNLGKEPQGQDVVRFGEKRTVFY